MSININVNITGFDFAELRELASKRVAANRLKAEESRRLEEARREALLLRASDMKAKGRTNSRMLLDGQFKRTKSEEEYIPSRVKPLNIGHFWTFSPIVNSSGETDRLIVRPDYSYPPSSWNITRLVEKVSISTVNNVKTVIAPGSAKVSFETEYGEPVSQLLPSPPTAIPVTESVIEKPWSAIDYERYTLNGINNYQIRIYDYMLPSCPQRIQLDNYINAGYPPTSATPVGWSYYELHLEANFTGIFKYEYNHDNGYIVLPCGRGNFILLVMANYDYEILTCDAMARRDNLTVENYLQAEIDLFRQTIGNIDAKTGTYPAELKSDITKHANGEAYNKAYICSNQSMREIEIPEKVTEFLNLINPQYSSQYRSFQYYKAIFSPVVIERPPCPNPGFDIPVTYTLTNYIGSNPVFAENILSRTPQAFYSSPNGFAGGNTHTPYIFKDINELYQFIEPQEIKDTPSQLKWLVKDEESSPFTGLKYGIWPIAGEDPYLAADPNTRPKPLPDATFYLEEEDIDPDLPDIQNPEYGANIHAVWDWGDPQYCQAMCRALGFTAQDLVP